VKLYNVVRKNTYYDSVTLMLISKQLKQLEGIDGVSVMMGTPANRVILAEARLLAGEGEAAGPNDLILAFRAPEGFDGQWVWRKIDEQLAQKAANPVAGAGAAVVRSAERAYQDRPESNLVFISVPGEYAALEAQQALKHGKNVFLFSDNVSLADEAYLKKIAAEKGLLVMGPDCGTAIINGVGIGFANKVRRGNIGLAAASGTGLQEVACLLDAMGLGVSQAIGTGGRDLKEEIGAITMIQALDYLLTDPATETVILISKPPAQSVVDKLLAKLAGAPKKVIVCFVGHSGVTSLPGVIMAATLEEAALKAAELNGLIPALLQPEQVLRDWVRQATDKLAPGQRRVRALYTGGTLCYEAMLIMARQLGPIYSNTPLSKELFTQEVLPPGKHSAIDFGDDEFTKGRPHPMIDPATRNQHILAAARDPETAVVLIDLVIGFGVGEDPAAELVPVLEEAKLAARAIGNELAIIAYVCGTNSDEQHCDSQREKLKRAGAFVARSNAEVARTVSMLIEGLGV